MPFVILVECQLLAWEIRVFQRRHRLEGLESTRTGEVSSGTSHTSLQRETRLDLEVVILACASARAFALSLLEGRATHGSDGPTPTTAEVIGDSRYAGFA